MVYLVLTDSPPEKIRDPVLYRIKDLMMGVGLIVLQGADLLPRSRRRLTAGLQPVSRWFASG